MMIVTTRKFDSIDTHRINTINMDLDLAFKSNTLVISDKLKISLVLIESMNQGNIEVILNKIRSMRTLNDVIIKMLNEALKTDLSEIKRKFIEKACDKTNMYIYNSILHKNIEDKDSTVKYILNTMNVCNCEIIDEIFSLGMETLIFNVFRNCSNVITKKHICSLVDKFKNEGTKKCLIMLIQSGKYI